MTEESVTLTGRRVDGSSFEKIVSIDAEEVAVRRVAKLFLIDKICL